MKRTATVIGGVFAFITGMASITPQLSKDLGKIMDGVYSYVPQWGFGVITITLVLFLWFINSPKKESSKSTLPANIENQQNISDNGTGLQNPIFNAPVTFVQSSGKKKDIETEKTIKEILELLLSFEKKFEAARHTSDRENNLAIFKETEFELHKIGTEYLPKTDSLLDDSEQLRDTFNELFRYSNIYGLELQDFLGYIKAGRVGEEIVIQKEISLRTDNGKAYSQVKKYIKLFRQQLKDRLP